MQPHYYPFHPQHAPQQHPQQSCFPMAQQPFPQVVYSNTKLEHINCVIPATEECGGLYIGDTIATLKTEYLLDNKIEALLCLNAEAAKNVQLTRFPLDFRYMEIQDHVDYPIYLHFESAYDFIESKLNSKKNVLVQCHGGVSRSATIICAYLIKKKQWIPEQALHYLKLKRHRAKPNAGFWEKLNEYWKSLNKEKFKEEQIKFKSPTKQLKNSIIDNVGKEEVQRKDKSVKKQLELTAAKSQAETMTPHKSPIKKQKTEPNYYSEKKSDIFSSPVLQRKKEPRSSQSATKAQTPFQYFKNQLTQQAPQLKTKQESMNQLRSTMPFLGMYQQPQPQPQPQPFPQQRQQPFLYYHQVPEQNMMNWQAKTQQGYNFVGHSMQNQNGYHYGRF